MDNHNRVDKVLIDQKDIIEAIAKHLGVTAADIDINASFFDDLGLGPVEVADMLSELSERFDVTFDPAETENMKTVGDLVVMIEDLSLE